MYEFNNTEENQSVNQKAVTPGILDAKNISSVGVQYQYETNIKQVPQCPPSDAKECDKDCWRYTLNPHTPNCFWPPARRNPTRVARNDYEGCSMWAISMYDTEEQADLAYSQLKKTIKNIKRAVGDHLSRGNVTVNDGKCTRPSHTGHFDFHPYANSAFSSNFCVIRQLP